jgi:hypothetical protein
MKKYIVVLLLMCLGCTSQPKTATIKITLTDGNRSLKVTGINDDILQEINRDSVTTGWQSLIPVYRMPADTDMKDYQTPQPGKYKVEANAVVFTPDTPFIKQQTYFVRFYRYSEGNNALDYIKQHKKLGEIPYTDLIFKQ